MICPRHGSKNDHVLKKYGMTHVKYGGKHTIGAASHHNALVN
jgi:hypothetical protein